MPTVQGRMKGFPTGSYEFDTKRVTRTYDDQFEVLAENENQGPYSIVTSVGIAIGDPFFDDLEAYAKRFTVNRSEVNRLLWFVNIHYSTQVSTDDAADAPKAPNDRRPRRRWTYETMQVPFTKDAIIANKEIVNSADEPFEDMVDFVIPVLTVERFELNFDPATILSYANHTNSGTFYGAPAKTVLCQGIEADDETTAGSANEVYQGVLYQRVRYVFKFKVPITEDNKGWVARYVDAGTRYKDGSTWKPYLTDPDPTVGKRERVVGPLNGSGGKLTPGADLVVLQFNRHPEADFSVLGV